MTKSTTKYAVYKCDKKWNHPNSLLYVTRVSPEFYNTPEEVLYAMREPPKHWEPICQFTGLGPSYKVLAIDNNEHIRPLNLEEHSLFYRALYPGDIKLRDTVDTLKEENRKLKHPKKDLEHENARIRDELERVCEKLEHANNGLKQYKKANKRLNEENERVLDELSKVTSRIGDYVDREEIVKHERQKMSREIDKLKLGIMEIGYNVDYIFDYENQELERVFVYDPKEQKAS